MRAAVLTLVLLLCGPAVAGNYYASTTGSGATCSIGSPCSLTGAQTVVRAAIAGGMSEDAVVYLRGGTYARTEVLPFVAADSGVDGHTVYWKSFGGERAVISGNAAITGWSATGGGIFQADVGARVFRELYVNGVPATRAQGDASTWAATATGWAAPAAVAGWGNLADVATVSLGGWTMAMGLFASAALDGDHTDIVMTDPFWSLLLECNANGYAFGTSPVRVENAYELLDAAGEWYLNRTTGIVYYKPTSGSMDGLTVEAPVVAAPLITITGVSNWQLHDVTIAGATWLAPDGTNGYVGSDSGYYWHTGYNWTTPYTNAINLSDMPAAIQVVGGQNVVLKGNTLTNNAPRVVKVSGGSQDVSIIDNLISQNGAGAIAIGEATTCPGTMETGAVVSRNRVLSSGFEYTDVAQVAVVCASGTTVVKNAIITANGIGIFTGWGWGASSWTPNTTVSGNYVNGWCTTFPDCGGIYSNSPQSSVGSFETGLRVLSNYVAGTSGSYRSKPLYVDNLAAWTTLTGNVTLSSVAQYWMMIQVDVDHVSATGNYSYPWSYTYSGAGGDVTVSGNTESPLAVPAYGTAAKAIICATGNGCQTPCAADAWATWNCDNDTGGDGYWIP